MRLISGRSLVLLAGLALALSACASGHGKTNPASGSQAGKGFRLIDAVVVERSYDPSGGGAGFGGGGTYTLAFEAKDGDATVHYSFPVTRTQYNHYVEGTHVQLVMADDMLRDIRPAPDK